MLHHALVIMVKFKGLGFRVKGLVIMVKFKENEKA